MKNLTMLIVLLIGGALQASCVLQDGGGGGGVDSGGAFLSVAWSLDPGCPDLAAAEVISLDVVTNEVYTDIFNCADGFGQTAALPLGDYDVWVEITTQAGDALYAQSNAVAVSLPTADETTLVDIPRFLVDDGFFYLTWTLADAGGAPLSCSDVFSGGVDIIATNASTSEAFVDVYDCTAGEGITAPVPVANYVLVVDVLDADDAALATSLPRENSISFGNELVDLGNFDFVFE